MSLKYCISHGDIWLNNLKIVKFASFLQRLTDEVYFYIAFEGLNIEIFFYSSNFFFHWAWEITDY